MFGWLLTEVGACLKTGLIRVLIAGVVVEA